jgi:CBS domain-containing protein
MSDTAIQSYHGSYLMPSLEQATVADAMHPGILSCRADATLTDVARMMATQHGGLAQQPVISVRPTMALREAGELMLKHGVSHVVVIGSEAQRPVGILSTSDVAGVLAWGEG